MRILAFDVSTTTIGWCVLDCENEKIKFVDCGFYKPPKDGNIFERLDKTKKDIKIIIDKYNPNTIAIEEIIKFMKGHSGAQTIIGLSVINRTVGLMAYDYLKFSPEMFSVLQIRHGIRRAANLKVLPKKEELPLIMENLLDINFPWLFNKKGNVKVESYDISDAMCCAFYCATKDTASKKK